MRVKLLGLAKKVEHRPITKKPEITPEKEKEDIVKSSPVC